MAPRKKKQPSSPPPPRFPIVAECYGDPGWIIGLHTHAEPSAFNQLRIDRFRITIEKIDEPPDVLLDRMRSLWVSMERNSHRWHPFWEKAKELGLTEAEARAMFNPHSQGSKRAAPK